MKNLIAVDGSERSYAAVQDCLNREWPEDTEFRVISVVDFFEPLPALEGDKKKSIEAARQLVRNYENLLKQRFPRCQVSGDVIDGYPKSKIREEAETWAADVIIMGSHGRTGFSRILLGSTSQALLHSANCSVRIVRQPMEEQKKAETVLIGLDDSEYSEAAVDHVLGRSWTEETKFICVHVITPIDLLNFAEPTSIYLEMVQTELKEMRDESEKLLQKHSSRLIEKFGAAQVSTVTLQGDARERILEHAEEVGADLIVLGSHGRNALGRAILGSVSDAVVSHAQCTVEIVKLPRKQPAKVGAKR